MDGHPTDILCLLPGYESLSSRQKKAAGDSQRTLEMWSNKHQREDSLKKEGWPMVECLQRRKVICMLRRTTLESVDSPPAKAAHSRKPGWKLEPRRDRDRTSSNLRTFNSQEDKACDIKCHFVSLWILLCIHFLETDLFHLPKESCSSRVPLQLSAGQEQGCCRLRLTLTNPQLLSWASPSCWKMEVPWS